MFYYYYLLKDLDATKPCYSKHISPVPWPLIASRFHCCHVNLKMQYGDKHLTKLNCLKRNHLKALAFTPIFNALANWFIDRPAGF